MFYQHRLRYVRTPQHMYMIKTIKNPISNFWGREGGLAGVGWRDGEKRHTTVIE